MQLNYSGIYTTSTTTPKAKQAVGQKIAQLKNALELNFMPGDNLLIKLKGEDFYFKQSQSNNKTNYLFADASLRYKLNKWKADIQVDCMNIAGRRQYTSLLLTASNEQKSIYNIRPRMLLIKLFFNF